MNFKFKPKNLIAVIICALLMTACSSAPKNVESSSESLTQSNSSTYSSLTSESQNTSSAVSSQTPTSGAAAANTSASTAYQSAASSKSGQAATSTNNSTSSKTQSTNSSTTSSKVPSYTVNSSSKPTSSSTTSRPTSNSTSSQITVKPPVSSSQPSTNTQSSYTQYARQVISIVNSERAKEGLPALKENASLMDSALIRSKELPQKFAHERPNGQQGYTLAQNAGFRAVGENIAYGQQSPEAVMQAWMNSSGHRANIMSKNFTSIGVGCYKGSNGQLYWTQLFGG